eukprot:3529595-Heterocapsa_arctica.AAC.1
MIENYGVMITTDEVVRACKAGTSAVTTTMATNNSKDVTGCAGNGVANMMLATTNQNDSISGWVRPDTEPYVR